MAYVVTVSAVPIGSQPVSWTPRLEGRFPEGLVNQGVSAELVAQKWGLTREELDAYSAESHRRASVAWKDGFFDAEVVPVRCVWRHHFGEPPRTLWGWLAELKSAAPSPEPTEVHEVFWLTPDEAVKHPDVLPYTDAFLEALLKTLPPNTGT